MDSDCDPCNECVEDEELTAGGRGRGRKRGRHCSPRVRGCRRDKDCRAGRRCVTPVQGNSGKPR